MQLVSGPKGTHQLCRQLASGFSIISPRDELDQSPTSARGANHASKHIKNRIRNFTKLYYRKRATNIMPKVL